MRAMREMTAVKRRIWLMATVLALFVLTEPLCALACLPGSEPPPMAGMAAADHADSHCQNQAPAPSHRTPSDPTRSHEDCGCEDAYAAVPASPPDGASNGGAAAIVVPSQRSETFATRAGWLPPAPLEATDLPPPDILLRKSTLIL